MHNRFISILLLVCVSAGYGAEGGINKRLTKAWDHVSLYEFDLAEPIFRQIRASGRQGSNVWIEATFGLAVSLHQKTPPEKQAIDEAKSLFLELAEKYPKHKFAPRALMNIARIYELRDYYKDKIQLKKAREYYRQVIDRYPDNPIVSEAILRLGQNYTSTFKPKEIKKGIKILTDWLKKHPKDRLAGMMYLHLGDVYFYPLKDYKKMVSCYVLADKHKGLVPGSEGFIYWRIAYIAQRKTHDRKTAIRYYNKLITEVPTFGRSYESQLALKEMGAHVPPLVLIGKKSE